MGHDVLIVDDSAVTRQMIKKTLGMAGLDVGDVYEAANGIEALAVLGDRTVAVMLLDINMPTMNGIQLLTRMKENARLQHIPVVIASTEGSKERITELERIGVFGYVRKPFQPEQLRDALVPLLGVKENGTANNGNADDGVF